MPASRRIDAVDAVKGLAIVLVVYGHVAQGVYHRGWWDSPVYTFQERFIYSFHMAAFFFVSGLFVRGSIVKQGVGQFIVQRMRTVLWPYPLCVIANGAEFFGAGSQAARHNLVRGFFISALTGEVSWFLPTLFLCLLLAALTNRLPVWMMALAALALNLLWPSTGIRIVDSAAHYFVFLAAGAWMNGSIGRVTCGPRWKACAACVAALLVVAMWILLTGRDLRIVSIIAGLMGTLGLFKLAHATRATAFERAALWCGTASLGIFVLHPFFQGATRLVLARLTSSQAVLPNLLIPTVVAVVGPGLLWHYRKPLRIEFLFVFPWGAPKPRVAANERENAVLAGSET
jgi:fucose 4-O-acetylase-like acetyltransferase